VFSDERQEAALGQLRVDGVLVGRSTGPDADRSGA
jgi:hypothetical protein